ncbi:MAG: GNAT family N-acetyltransferase [Methanomassiliicoccales archaeon]|nr:GNAT family N-acetyltransferase [Methanomassiliicoccales archaeon]
MIRIRELRVEEYDRLVELWQAAELPYRPMGRDRREAVARELEGPTALFLVAEEGDRLVGSILGTHDGRKGWINRLAVLPSHRRAGVAQALVSEVERRLRRKKIGIIACLIENGNEPSEALFARLGYIRQTDIVYYAKRFDPEI